MDLTFLGLLLTAFCWTALSSESDQTGILPPPSRVSLRLVNEFCVNLSWSPPENWNRSTCGVKYSVEETKSGEPNLSKDREASLENKKYTRVDTFYANCIDLDNGVTYTVRTLSDTCGQINNSEGVTLSIPPSKEKLVKDFQCIYYSSGSMNCTWNPIGQTSDLHFYYWYETDKIHQPLAPCHVYLYNNNLKTGCHLHGDFLNITTLENNVFFLIKGKRGNSTVQNTFSQVPRDNVKPSPPKLKILQNPQEPNRLKLTWEAPSGFDPDLKYWKYEYRISKCEGEKVIYFTSETEEYVPYDKRCQFKAQVRAICSEICGKGESDWSQEEYYGQDSSDWSFYVVFIAVPVIVTVCVILFLLFLKKLQVLVLPQIPDPRKFLKELINSNEDQTVARSNLSWDKGLQKTVFIPETPEVCLNINMVERIPIMKP